MRAARWLRRHRWLAAIALLALVLDLVGIRWGLPFDLSWSVDDIAPWKPLSLPFRYFEGHHKYPYLHWFLSLALYAPYLAWLALRGELDLACLPTIELEEQCFADPFGHPGTLMLISRLLSAAMGVGIVLATYALAVQVHGDRIAARFAALATAACGGVVFYAHVGNLEVPMVFWFAISLVFFVRLLRAGARRDYLAFGLTAGCTLATKEAVLGAYVAAGLAIYAAQLHRARVEHGLDARTLARASFDRRLLELVGCVLLVYGLVNNVVFNWDGFAVRFVHWMPGGEEMANFRVDFPGYLPFFRGFFRTLRDETLGAPLFWLCAAGAAWSSWRHPFSALLLLPAVSYAWLSVAQAGWAPLRFMLPLVPILAVYGGVLAARLVRTRPLPRAFAAALLVAVFGHALAYCVYVDLLLRNDSRHRAEAWIREHVAPEASIATWSNPIDLPRLTWLGYRPDFFTRDADGEEALLASRAEWVVLSSNSYGPFEGRRKQVGRDLVEGLEGYRLEADLVGTTPLDRWFRRPLHWINPRILVFRRVPS